jgi:phage-related minor tail protein
MLPKAFTPTENIGPAPVEVVQDKLVTAILRELNGGATTAEEMFELEMQEREYERYMERKFGSDEDRYDRHHRHHRARRFEQIRQQIDKALSEQKSPGIQTYEQKVEEARKNNRNAYAPWTNELENELRKKYDNGNSIAEIAAAMGRSKWAIETRLEKMNLIKKAS